MSKVAVSGITIPVSISKIYGIDISFSGPKPVVIITTVDGRQDIEVSDCFEAIRMAVGIRSAQRAMFERQR